MKKTNQIETLNMLYSIYRHIEETEDITIYEAYLKKAVSNAISIIRNDYLMIKPTITRFYSYRLIIESLVIMKQYEGKENDDIGFLYEFLRSYNFYLDFKYISEDCLGDGLEEFCKTESLKYYDIFVNLILNSQDLYLNCIDDQFPFLKDNYSYLKQIKSLYPNLYELYYELKVLTDMGSNDAKLLAVNAIDRDLITKCNDKILSFILDIAKKYFENNNIILIKKYDSDFYILNTDNKQKYCNYQCLISKALKDVANVFDEWDDLFEFKATLVVMSEMIEDIVYDVIDESYDVYLSKLKLIFETLALNYYSIAGGKVEAESLGFMECNKQAFSNLRFKKYYYLNKKGKDLEEFNNDVMFYKDFYCSYNTHNINFDNPLYFFDIKGLSEKDIINEYLLLLHEKNLDDYIYCVYIISCRLQSYGYLLDNEFVRNKAVNTCISDVLTYHLIISYINVFKDNKSFHSSHLADCLVKLMPLLSDVETNITESNEVLIDTFKKD